MMIVHNRHSGTAIGFKSFHHWVWWVKISVVFFHNMHSRTAVTQSGSSTGCSRQRFLWYPFMTHTLHSETAITQVLPESGVVDEGFYGTGFCNSKMMLILTNILLDSNCWECFSLCVCVCVCVRCGGVCLWIRITLFLKLHMFRFKLEAPRGETFWL